MTTPPPANGLARLPVSPDDVSSLGLRIDCPDFNGENAARLEAEARVEVLSAKGLRGEVFLQCSVSSATLTWLPRDRHPRSLSVPLATDAASSIDAILGTLHALLATSAETSASSSGAPPAPRAHVKTPGAADGPKKAGIWVAEPRAGFQAEFTPFGALSLYGAYAGVRLKVPEDWSLSLVGTSEWSSVYAVPRTAVQLQLWFAGATLLVEHSLVPNLEVGVGPVAQRVVLLREVPATESTRGPYFDFGGVLRVGYGLPIGPVTLEAAALGALFPSQIEVVDGSSVRTLFSNVMLGVSIGARVRLF